MVLIYPKLYVECRDSVGDKNDENSKGSNCNKTALSAEIDDKFECMGVPTAISIIEKRARSCYVNIFSI